MKTVAAVIGGARPNLVEQLWERPSKRIGMPSLPDHDLADEIKVVVAGFTTQRRSAAA